MANQNSSVNGNVVDVTNAMDMFTQFLAKNDMSVDDNGDVVKVIDTVGMNDDKSEAEMETKTEVVVCYVQKGKNGITMGTLDKALKSGAPVIEFRLRHGVSNTDVRHGLKELKYVFEIGHHDAERNVIRNMKHSEGLAPDYVSIMGRNRKKAGTKGLHRFELA